MSAKMTPALTRALRSLAGQQMIALRDPGAYSANRSGGDSNCTVTQLRALCRRGFAERADRLATESYIVTDAGLQVVAEYVREQAAESYAVARRFMGSEYPGIVAMAEREQAAADAILARI